MKSVSLGLILMLVTFSLLQNAGAKTSGGAKGSVRTNGAKKRKSKKVNTVRLEYPTEPSMVDVGLKQASHGIQKMVKMGRGFGKGTVDLLAGKHVYLDQILGKWRLMQDVEIGKGAMVSCPATLEFCDGGEVRSYFEDQECITHFTFRERAWPKYCTISFEAEAFQGPNDDTPVRMFYKGKFKKSILNPNVIFIRGRMYRIRRNVFGAKKRLQVGKFKMTQTRYSLDISRATRKQPARRKKRATMVKDDDTDFESQPDVRPKKSKTKGKSSKGAGKAGRAR